MQEFQAKFRVSESTDVVWLLQDHITRLSNHLVSEAWSPSMVLNESTMPHLSLDVDSIAKEIYLLSSVPVNPARSSTTTSCGLDQFDDNTNVTDTDIDTDPFSSMGLKTTTNAIPMDGPLSSYWSQFLGEPIPESNPVIHLDQVLMFQEHSVPVPSNQPTTCSSVSTSMPPPPPPPPDVQQRMWSSMASITTLVTTATSNRKLSESTGNKNRRAKRKAKVGEMYATGTMKRQAEPKPYDRMVKKYRIKM